MGVVNGSKALNMLMRFLPKGVVSFEIIELLKEMLLKQIN